MPNREPRTPWTEAGLKAKITGLGKKIGEATAQQDDSTANTLRERRVVLFRKLAQKFNVWSLINPEGKTEFVDRAEWEQRMIAWGRRNGHIPRAVVAETARRVRPAAPPAETPAAPPAAPGAGGPPILPPTAGPLPPADEHEANDRAL